MPVITSGDADATSALLVLRVQTPHLVEARHAGAIIERLGNAFAQHLRATPGRQLRGALVVERIELGSMVAFLRDAVDTVGAALTIYDHRDLLGGFVAQFGDAVQSVLAGRPDHLRPAIRSAIASMVRPIALANAESVSLQVHGDNNNVFIINRSEGVALHNILQSPRPLEERLSGATYAIREEPAALRTAPHIRASDFRERTSSVPEASAANDDGGDVTMGTMLNAKGAWYVRPEGFSGTLLPLTKIEPGSHLNNDAEYLVRGRVVYSRERPIGFDVAAIVRRTG